MMTNSIFWLACIMEVSRYLPKHSFGCFYDYILDKINIYMLDWIGRLPSFTWVSTHQLKSLNRTKRLTFLLLDCVQTGMSAFSCLQTQAKTLAFPGSSVCQPSDWNHTVLALLGPQLANSPCMNLRTFSLHNCVNQFLMINLFIYIFIYIYIVYWFCFFEECNRLRMVPHWHPCFKPETGCFINSNQKINYFQSICMKMRRKKLMEKSQLTNNAMHIDSWGKSTVYS